MNNLFSWHFEPTETYICLVLSSIPLLIFSARIVFEFWASYSATAQDNFRTFSPAPNKRAFRKLLLTLLNTPIVYVSELHRLFRIFVFLVPLFLHFFVCHFALLHFINLSFDHLLFKPDQVAIAYSTTNGHISQQVRNVMES